MSLIDELSIRPGKPVDLGRIDAAGTHGLADNEETEGQHERLVERIGRLAHTLGADKRFGVLVVLQGMDTSGKDGTIRKVFAAIDPATHAGPRLQEADRPRAGPRLPLANPWPGANPRPVRHLQPLAL